MASATISEEHTFDPCSKDCREFFPGFLKCLEPDLRKEYLQVLHATRNKLIDDPYQQCEKVTTEISFIRGDNPSAHYLLLKELAHSLNATEAQDSAVKLTKQYVMEDDPQASKNYWIYLILGQLYCEMGNYVMAKEAHENALKATNPEEVLKKAVATIKLAIDLWHSRSPELGRQYQREAIGLLEEVEPGRLSLKDQNTEEAILYLDMYKTHAYFFRIQDNKAKATECSTKVLEIVNLSSEALLQASKIHAILAVEMAFKAETKYSAKRHVAKAKTFIFELIEDHNFMLNHSASPIHVISKIGHCFQKLGDLDESLTARLKGLELAKIYFGETHPEVARASADVALLYYLTKNMREMDEYIELTENVLEDCSFESDMAKKQLYVRELSDAMQGLGSIFTSLSFFSRAEIKYKCCLDLNISVYRENHQRVGRVYRSMGLMYSRWEKYDEAKEAFNKCIEINQAHRPQNDGVISKVRNELARIGKAEGKKRRQKY